MRWAGHVARMGEVRDVYSVLVENHEGKRPLGRPRRRWEDNNRMNLQEVGCGGMDWIELGRPRRRWEDNNKINLQDVGCEGMDWIELA